MVPLCKSEKWYYYKNNNTALPFVDECFRLTVLVWAPALFFWILLPVVAFQLYRKRVCYGFEPLLYTPILIAKQAITLLLLIDSVFLFFLAFVDGVQEDDGNAYRQRTVVYFSFPIVRAFTMLFMLICLRVARTYGVISMGILHVTWLIHTVCAAIDFYNMLVDENNSSSTARYIAYAIWALGVFAQSILFCFADKRSINDHVRFERSPEDASSFVNRSVFWWFNTLPFRGAKQDLVVEDLFPLNHDLSSAVLVKLWERYWKPSIEEYYAKKRALQTENALLLTNSTSVKGISNGSAQKKKFRAPAKRLKLEPPSVVYNLFKMFKWEFLAASAIKMFSDVLQFANPFLLKLLIDFVSLPDAPLWQGIGCAILMYVASQIRSFAINHYFFIMFRMGTKIQTALTTAIYKKTLVLNNESRQNRTSGEVVNLMAIDVERFQLITGHVQQFWSSPFQIVLALIFLFNTLGVAAFPGVIIMAIFVPFSIFSSIFSKKYQMRQMKFKDERAKMCSEILSGIKVIKLYAWEMPMMEAIERIRVKELSCILKAGLIRCTLDVFNFSSPFLVAICSFLTYSLIDRENLLTPQVAFVSLTLFNQLRSPMTMIGLLINMTVQTIVSNKRIKEFLVADEVDQTAVDYSENGASNEAAIVMRDADFSWGSAAPKRAAMNGEEKDEKRPYSTGSSFATLSADETGDEPVSKLTLQHIKLDVARGELLAIVGRVGCGKSSLLAALLGEMERLRGEVRIRGRIAYVPQTAWIQNMSVRDNITFGRPFHRQLYGAVVEACALKADMAILPYGDATEIGEKGINLSGGQKARVSLARAVYQNCDIYLLDDPLSAVDSHVGKHIFDKVIGPNGLLRNKTRLFVTNGIGFLKETNRIAMMEDGQIKAIGTDSELLESNKKYGELVHNIQESPSTALLMTTDEGKVTIPLNAGVDGKKPKEAETDGVDENEQLFKDFSKATSEVTEADTSVEHLIRRLSTISKLEECISSQESGRRPLSRSPSSVNSSTRSSPGSTVRRLAAKRGRNTKIAPITEIETAVSNDKTPASKEHHFNAKKLIQKERVDTGRVKASVYVDYMRSAGFLLSFSFMFLFCSFQALQIGRNVWLSRWADDNDRLKQKYSAAERGMNTTTVVVSLGIRLVVYGLFGALEAASFFLALVALLFAGLSASHNLHLPVLERILHAPMAFFDTTPSGRILNRLGKDVETIDMQMALSFRYFTMCITQVIGSLLIITITTPVFAAVIVPLTAFYLMILKFYVPTSRQLRRLESTNRSPIYSHFGETIHGVTTIRAFNKNAAFCEEIERRIEHFIRIKYQSVVANRWLAIRLEFVGNCVVFFAALFGALSKEWGLVSSAGLVGLSVSYALNITEVLNFAIRQVSELETNIVSVERLKEYAQIETEAAWHVEENKLPMGWPQRGAISFCDYSTRYRPGLELVVRNINAEIAPTEKVGIVGRTGAGKSSLTLALFRMIEPVEGAIVIDDVNITQIGLQDLRSNLTIIPQDPVLFSGTLRFNLDPFKRYSDAEIWQVLELAHLKLFASSLADGLEHEITEGGSNISLGQRQLVCLARALLRRSKILVLDEATAAVDLSTDALIQETIRTEFRGSTIITIAHRLNTILDYNRVMVLESGEMREFDAPQRLLADRSSLFAGMAADAGLTGSGDDEHTAQKRIE